MPDPVGTHVLIDLYDATDLGDACLPMLRDVAETAGLTIMKESEHIFEGGGRTAFLVLGESHTSIHTWPEAKTIYFDLFSCRKLDPEAITRVMSLVMDRTKSRDTKIRITDRGKNAP